MKCSVMHVLLFIILPTAAQGQPLSPISPVFQSGEELRYKVKWNFFRLGTITIRTLHASMCTELEDYKIHMIVESNPDLSFIWIREFNESIMDARSLFSRGFRGDHRNGNDLCQIQQSYDRERRIATSVIRDLNSGAVLRADTLRDVDPYVEGPSLFITTRCISRFGKSLSVPTMVGGKIAATDLNFSFPLEEVEIDAVDMPVRVHKYEGFAHWKGGSEAGLSGEFTGWITDDDAAVPVRAEMKVILGSIRLELESWNRPGWVPPTGLRASNQ